MGTMGTHAGVLSQMRCLRTRVGSGLMSGFQVSAWTTDRCARRCWAGPAHACAS